MYKSAILMIVMTGLVAVVSAEPALPGLQEAVDQYELTHFSVKPDAIDETKNLAGRQQAYRSVCEQSSERVYNFLGGDVRVGEFFETFFTSLILADKEVESAKQTTGIAELEEFEKIQLVLARAMKAATSLFHVGNPEEFLTKTCGDIQEGLLPELKELFVEAGANFEDIDCLSTGRIKAAISVCNMFETAGAFLYKAMESPLAN